MGILLQYAKYTVNFVNYKSYCFRLIYQIKKYIKKEKNVKNFPRWEMKQSQRAENPETMIYTMRKKVITRE